jgi:hypothetical protein
MPPFQRLKDDENERLSLSWDLNRTLSKINYRIHTDAIKAKLIPSEISKAQAAVTYASEADLLNVALFSCTAKEWRDANPKLKGNIRDHASIEQLLVLANIESMNADVARKRVDGVVEQPLGTPRVGNAGCPLGGGAHSSSTCRSAPPID